MFRKQGSNAKRAGVSHKGGWQPRGCTSSVIPPSSLRTFRVGKGVVNARTIDEIWAFYGNVEARVLTRFDSKAPSLATLMGA